MKPSDRSLEIVAIGLGQAGGNIAAEFEKRGYRALAFNTAQTDLSSLGASRTALPEAQRIDIGLEGGDGAGSDADYGRECIAAHADEIRDAVKQHASGADVVVLCAGLGGGTGSCAAEFAATIADLALPIVILTTLPHSYESGIAKVNALCGVRDLAKMPSHGWVLIDNARLSRIHRDAPIDTYFEVINREIVEPLDLFNRLNERDSLQAIRTLDGEDSIWKRPLRQAQLR
jgi:cell division protein FtsZ